ncbi:2-phospho-L-lactate guanylyltransferase [bacterium HR39]|nr:2-phospho-L-lactate guanylyltransferase [bacterium HR39]
MSGPVPALVLAGSRRGEADAVARAAGVPHRALAPVGGRAMLARVLDALAAEPRIDGVLVSTDRPDLLAAHPDIAPLLEGGRVRLLESRESLSASVLDALERTGLPLLVTTADHALLDSRTLARFLDGAERADGDLAFAVVPRSLFLRRFPGSRRTWWRFREDGYSGANLFLLRGAAARRMVERWRRIERERKRPWRIVVALGPHLLLAYLLRRLTLARAVAALSRRLGVEIRPVVLDVPEAAVDVDRPEDLRLAESVLAARSAAPQGAA